MQGLVIERLVQWVLLLINVILVFLGCGLFFVSFTVWYTSVLAVIFILMSQKPIVTMGGGGRRFRQFYLNVFHLRFSSIEVNLPSMDVFYQSSSSIDGCLPLKVILNQRSSSIAVCLPSKVISHLRSSFLKGLLPSKAVFHQRLSSIEGLLTSSVRLC